MSNLSKSTPLDLDGRGEPVLPRRRSLAVLVVQDGGGWSSLWDAVHRTTSPLIAGVAR